MRATRTFLVLVSFLAPCAAGQVRVVQVESRTAVADGRSFGSAGTYERLDGWIEFRLDPDNLYNSRIVDLDRAPTDGFRRVRSRANFTVMQAADPARRCGTALLEVSNRGGRAALRYLQNAREDDVGDGLLFRRGITLVWVGWQCDVPEGGDRLRLEVPRIRGIEGPVRCDWVVDERTVELPLGHRGHEPYAVVDPSSSLHTLTKRTGRDAPRSPVARDAWQFSADGRAIVSVNGFDPGFVYELVVQSQDPTVVGMGLAAIRDMASALRNDRDCPFGVSRVIAMGISQTGRFLRHAIYQGFITDTEGHPVFDGLLIFAAGAGRGSFNHRFAQPSRDAHRSSAFYYPTDLFPFSSSLQEDPVQARFDGLFAHCFDPDHLPKVFAINTGYEYWGRAAALIHTSVDGKRDVPPSDRERLFHIASAQHYPTSSRELGAGRRSNDLRLLPLYRALTVAMIDWVEHGRAPPASAIPRLADGTLVPLAELRHPLALSWPRIAHSAHRVDYGTRFFTEGIVDLEPPRVGRAFPTLVPQVDSDGNELGGLRPLELRVPLASYLPWSLRADAEIADFEGFSVPFDEAQRLQHYRDREQYAQRLRDSAATMIEERTLLAEDADSMVDALLALWPQ